MKASYHILPVIVLSQFCCTSLWFAGNGVMTDLIEIFELAGGSLAWLTSAVQLGFITGTLVFALLTLSDRFSPSRVFFSCAIIAAVLNLGIIWSGNTLPSLISIRFGTGFFLAGIYPVGMKIAADHFKEGLGKSLGYLVGALVLGTSLPHLLKEFSVGIPWIYVIIATSSLSIFGGALMMGFVSDGPYRKAGSQLDFSAFFRVFKNRNFRSAAFGYFGHMWELYAFWAFVPVILETYKSLHSNADFSSSLFSFLIIGIGGISCVIAGYASQRIGAKRTAFTALLISGLCCLVSPLFFEINSEIIFIGFLLIWGLTVIADSPMFSTMVANNASSNIKGTALTVVNCIGFAITIVSIQLLSALKLNTDSNFIYMVLALGPIMGLIALKNVSTE